MLLVLASPSAARVAQQPTVGASELQTGRQLLDAGRLVEAERAFMAAVAKTPSDAGAWNWLGSARFALKHWTPAIEAFEKCRALAPKNTDVLGNIGVCWFSLTEFDKARECFEQAVALDDKCARCHMFLGRIASNRGDDARTESEYKLAVANARDEPLAPFYFGLFLFQQRRLGEAKAAFELCLELSPDTPGAHLTAWRTIASVIPGRRA